MNKKIFVGSIPNNFQISDVLNYFRQFGELEGFVRTAQSSNNDHICGVLTCENEVTAKKILQSTHVLNKQVLDCHVYLQGERLKEYLKELNLRNVYITEIPFECTYNQLKCVFGKFGKIQNIKFLESKKVREKYAVVTFFEVKAAQAALKKKRIRGLGGLIKIKVFKDKKTKKKTYEGENTWYNNGSNSSWNRNGNFKKGNSCMTQNNNDDFGRGSQFSNEKNRRILKEFSFKQNYEIHELFSMFRWSNPVEKRHKMMSIRFNR